MDNRAGLVRLAKGQEADGALSNKLASMATAVVKIKSTRPILTTSAMPAQPQDNLGRRPPPTQCK